MHIDKDGIHHRVVRYSPSRHCNEKWVMCTYRTYNQRGAFDS